MSSSLLVQLHNTLGNAYRLERELGAGGMALFAGAYDSEFDVTPDGTRFLMMGAQSTGIELVVVPNWRTELPQLTATSNAR